MGWKSDPAAPGDVKDRTKLLWFGIVGLCGAMLLALWLSTGEDTTRTRARVKHILIRFTPGDAADRARAFAQISDIKQWLNDGQSFESIAKDYSNDPKSSSRGGDLGWVEPEELTGPVDQFVWSGEENQVSGIITTQFGYHLVWVTSRSISDTMKYERDLKEDVLGGEDDDTGNEAP